MSELTMILTMAIAVPGNGPERDSVEVEQRLHLRGQWSGTNQNCSGTYAFVGFNNGRVTWFRVYGGAGRLPRFFRWNYRDEGEGKLRFDWFGHEQLGIYKQDPDRLIICYRDAYKGRPTSFRCGDGQQLLILHCVKTGK